MPIRCEIVSQDRLVWEGDADIVNIPGSDGDMGILPNHAPLLSTMRYGIINVRTGGATPIARFLERRGEGIHHVCFEVDDLDAALERFRNAGLNVTGGEGSARQEERAGAEGSRIAFIHPRSTGGVLIELRETGGGKR